MRMPNPVDADTGPDGDPVWHGLSVDEILETIRSRKEGLAQEEAERRLAEYGPNSLRAHRGTSVWRILLRQFKSVVIIVLVLAGLVAVAVQEWPESIAIAAVIAINVAIGLVSEWKAMRAMEALQRLGEHTARVRRDGEEVDVPAQEVVPGDVVILRAEALVPADLRVISAEGVQANESALTGESVPVFKRSEPVAEETTLSERASMLYKGTTVVDGAGEGVAVATGMATEVGRISELAEEAEAAATPLQQKLDQLGRRMAVVVLLTAVIIGTAGLLAGREPTLMIETAIALGVAAIPEGLPIVATIALAAGMWLMARRNAIVNRLPAVETLGATRVIFSDKTGTLTENRMVVSAVITLAGRVELDGGKLPASNEGGGALVRHILHIGVLCNGAALNEDADEDGPRGDPMEIALLEAGAESELLRERLLERLPEVHREPFARETMKMATVHERDNGFLVAVKGAPEDVLRVCDRLAVGKDEERHLGDEDRKEWLKRAGALALEGLRLLAVAEKQVPDKDVAPYDALRFLGLIALRDPPREDVREAINACQSAGIRVVMVTGDKPETGESIAEKVGIVGDPDDEAAHVLHGRDLKPPEELDEADEDRIHRANIFARVTPEQKLNLVKIYQDRGDTLAMTGDGINDAPALKKADIGVAMGRRGTEAAKQVADMVLRDDALSSIVAAVEQGRVIFGNIRKSVMFMLCTNGAEVLAVAVAALLNAPLPLRPLQILFLNVLTDVLPALALGVGKGDAHVMDRPPRDPEESVLTRRHWLAIGGWSVTISCCVLGAMFAGLRWLGLGELPAVTVSFLTLGFTKLWFVFNLRSPSAGMLRNEVTQNPWIWGALVLCAALLVSAVYLPELSKVLETQPIGPQGWALVLMVSMVPLLLGQILLWFGRRRDRPAV